MNSSGELQGSEHLLQEADQERQLQRMIDRLLASERLALVGQSTAQIAHHLTNQLCVLPLIQLMEREYASDAQLVEFLGVLRESFQQISDTVQQIRRLVRFESIEESPQPVLLGDAVREATAFLRHRKGFPWGRLRLDLRDDAIVLSSRLKLHHILVNLLYNAADAVARQDDGRILVRLSKDADCGMIEVEDNGIGISANLLGRVWDPTYSTKPGSIHGLGLHLVRRLVEGDGGQVGVRSIPGQQTTFVAALPLAKCVSETALMSFEEDESAVLSGTRVMQPA